MKILSVIESMAHGGAESVLVDLVTGLHEHEHRVVHFSSANGIRAAQTFIDTLRRHRVDCADVHWAQLRDDIGRAELLADFSPDVVFFHWWAKDPWMPWVWSLQDEPISRRPAFVCVLHHHGIRVMWGYDRYVLVTRSQLEQVRHVESKRVVVLPNGVDLRRFRKKQRKWSDELVVGRVSNLNPNKIPPNLPSILASFELPKTKFIIAGDGEVMPKLRASALATRSADQFSFPGYVPRVAVPALLESFDVFCYTTSTAVECHPLALLEALAAGLPIVADARGGIPEIVKHNVNGLLSNSRAEMGAHLNRLRRDEHLRRRLGEGALATARQFSGARQLDAYRALLADIERQRGRNAGRLKSGI
jgi:glycosyltransferase involved in cell wall biosynthesis